jgi:hypothetical protein
MVRCFILIVLFLISCSNNNNTLNDSKRIKLSADDLVLISDYSSHEKKIIELSVKCINENLSNPFVEDYFRLIKDTTLVKFFTPVKPSHNIKNILIGGFNVSINPFRNLESDYLIKLYNDSLGRLKGYKLVIDFNTDYSLKSIKGNIITAKNFVGKDGKNYEKTEGVFDIIDNNERIFYLFRDSLPDFYNPFLK